MIGLIVLLMFLIVLVIGILSNADNTFGEGFDWETAPWYSVEGLQDIANLHDKVIAEGNLYTVESLQTRGEN